MDEKEQLEELILSTTEAINKMVPGTEEHTKATNDLVNLMKTYEEMKNNEADKRNVFIDRLVKIGLALFETGGGFLLSYMMAIIMIKAEDGGFMPSKKLDRIVNRIISKII